MKVLRLAVRLLLLAAVIGVVAAIVPGIHEHGGFGWLVITALIFALLNMLIRPALIVLGFPLIVVTLGLFLLVINAALLGITAALTSHLDIDGFWSAVFGALLISVFTALTGRLLPGHDNRDDRRRHR